MKKSIFKLGDSVARKEFVDCFGRVEPRIDGLRVENVRTVNTISIAPYYRVKAVCNGGYVEGSERFFKHI